MIVDDVTIRVQAGNGGDGAVAFNKNLLQLGPVGGNGGDGGNVYAEGVAELDMLNQFRFKKDIRAADGERGKRQNKNGLDSEDIILKVPVGTVIHNLILKTDGEVTHIGERVLLAKGGMGGRGNFHFRSATNQSPKQFEKGTTFVYERKSGKIYINGKEGSLQDKREMIELGTYMLGNCKESDMVTVTIQKS